MAGPATQTLDTTATSLTRSYATSGGVLMTETVAENAHGQWTGRTRADSEAAGSEQAYSYDANGRLTAGFGCMVMAGAAFGSGVPQSGVRQLAPDDGGRGVDP
ncbi:MAG: hypothetical protein ACT4QF_18540 [Sporichthyaceae bacterium]